MSLIMADAVDAHNIPTKLIAAVAGYDTGTGIKWSDSEWALFPTFIQKHIDQGGTDAPVYTADIIDIETGAYTPDHVFPWMVNSTKPRPTVYVNRGNEMAACNNALQSPKFKGDVWLAYPDWVEGQPLPVLPVGCHYVAVQNVFAGGYDLSTILDESWLTANGIPPPTPTTPTEAIVQSLPIVKLGMGTLPSAPSKYVRNAQSLLISHGVSCGPAGADGRCGTYTDAAIRAFQEARGLQIDGEVGTEQTWPALLDV